MSDQTLTTFLFLSVVALTIGITFWASRQTKTAADFYSGGRSFSTRSPADATASHRRTRRHGCWSGPTAPRGIGN